MAEGLGSGQEDLRIELIHHADHRLHDDLYLGAHDGGCANAGSRLLRWLKPAAYGHRTDLCRTDFYHRYLHRCQSGHPSSDTDSSSGYAELRFFNASVWCHDDHRSCNRSLHTAGWYVSECM